MTEPTPPPPFSDGTPMIVMSFHRVLCPRHGEIFRENWPSGYPIFMVEAFGSLKLREEVPLELSIEDHNKWIEKHLDEKPMCCRYTRDELLKLFLNARKWKRRLCINCKELRDGAAFHVTLPDGEQKRYRHVCLWCVIYKLEPHDKARPDEFKRHEDEEQRG